jgi:hypothetical protein
VSNCFLIDRKLQLSIIETTQLSSYEHLREPQDLDLLFHLRKRTVAPSGAFLDTLDRDAPKGSWSVNSRAGGLFVELRSLVWPGYVLNATAGAPTFTSAYFGDGQRNKDLYFIM